MNYVYKITNTLNGKIYIGKRKHDDPTKDTYMGSGKLILAAIKKHGKKNFSKEIIAIFENNDDAAALEASLVTKEFISSGVSYNLHEGGHGGFAHINSLAKEERVNVKAFREKHARGEIKTGGNTTQFFTEDSYRKIREASAKGNEILKGISQEQREKINKKISESNKGERNSQSGKVWCVLETADNLSERISVFNIPDGYISTTEWKERRKSKKNNTYGKHWYNDGVNNFLLSEDDEKTISLKRGRITT